MPSVLPILLTATAVWAQGPAAAQTPACPAARPLTVTTLCLINQARAQHGAPRLRVDRRLRRAARRHSLDMVAHRYFSHTSRSGLSSSGRIARTGWMRGRRRWIVGENLAWRKAPAGAHSVVQAWLRSPEHRRVLLDGGFRVAGIGIARGTPFGGAGATYTADFGS
jgi:uncharacterized protein YkwD